MVNSRLVTIAFAIIAAGLGCNGEQGLLLPAGESVSDDLTGLTLVARIAHITDTHVLDEQSPARFAQAYTLTGSAWRPYEAYSTQLLDGVIRAVNRIHASGRQIDFLLHTGDACDNAQSNELAWLIAIMDGDEVDPLSGPDDRAEDAKPDPTRDPHATFQAQGLYRTNEHGPLASIPWYIVPGNHDQYAIGVFPIVEWSDGSRTTPLLLERRPGVWLPLELNPLSSAAYGRVTPADPGPPCLFETPQPVEPSDARAYFRKAEYAAALMATVTEPPGHGHADHAGAAPATTGSSSSLQYSVSPIDGVCLIGLDTTDLDHALTGLPYEEGTLSRDQLAFLRAELDAALERDQTAIVASHHPSSSLLPARGSEVAGDELRALLNEYPNVALHIAGHKHRNRVIDQGGYLEIETCSTLDPPQELRLIEIWREDAGGKLVISYEMFSHIDDTLPELPDDTPPELGDDPLRELREDALAIAIGDATATARQKRLDPTGTDPHGKPTDRQFPHQPK